MNDEMNEMDFLYEMNEIEVTISISNIPLLKYITNEK